MPEEIRKMIEKYGLDRVLCAVEMAVQDVGIVMDQEIPGNKESRRLHKVACALDMIVAYCHERKLLSV